MKVAWYAVTVILGAFGALGLLRVIERLAFGGGQGSIAAQLLVSAVALFLAWKAFGQARSQ